MKIKELWSKMGVEKRKRLLAAIYNNNFFDYLCEFDYDSLIDGVKRRLERLETVAAEINI